MMELSPVLMQQIYATVQPPAVTAQAQTQQPAFAAAAAVSVPTRTQTAAAATAAGRGEGARGRGARDRNTPGGNPDLASADSQLRRGQTFNIST